MQFKRILALFPVILSSCTYGPQTEKKSVADYFSRKNYEATATLGGVIPIAVKRKNAVTVVSGKIYQGDGIQPLKYGKVVLTRGSEVIAEGNTDNIGDFVIKGVIPNGHYRLEVVDKESEGFRDIQIESYELKKQDIITHRKVAEEGKSNR